MSAGHLAELMVIDNARATAAVKECWKQRLQALKKDLGYEEAPLLEKLLIQQAALCWLKLNLVELSYSGTMAQSITLTLGIYWEKRLSAAQRRFTRACETLARVRKLSRNTLSGKWRLTDTNGRQESSGLRGMPTYSAFLCHAAPCLNRIDGCAEQW